MSPKQLCLSTSSCNFGSVVVQPPSCCLLAVSLIVFAFVTVGACSSGVGVEAPTTLGPRENVGACPDGDTQLLSLKAEVDDGAFDALRPTITRIFVDNGGLKTALALLSAVLPKLQAAEMRTVLAVISSGEGRVTLDAVKPHVLNVLKYVHGTSEFIDGAHLEPLHAFHELLVSCDAAEQLLNLRNVVALEVNRTPNAPSSFAIAPAGSGEASWVFAFVEAVDRAAQLPKMRSLLQRIEIEDGGVEGGPGQIQVGRAAFIVMAKLLAKNVAAPDFEFQPTREIFEQVAIPRLDGDAEAEAVLAELLDLFGLLVSADSATFEGMQAFMGCIDRHDDQAAIPTMLFDYVNIEELPIESLIGDVAVAFAGQRLESLRMAGIAIADVVVQQPVLLGDATLIMAELVAPDVADTTVGTVLAIAGTGVLSDFIDFITLVLECKEIPL